MKKSQDSLMVSFFGVTIDRRIWNGSMSIFSYTPSRHLVMRPSVVCILQMYGTEAVHSNAFLKNGTFLGISKEGLTLFFQESDINKADFSEKRRCLEDVPEEDLGDCTKPIVALFLNLGDAMLCVKSENLIPDDPRWKYQTRDVLHEIGLEHPFFAISRANNKIHGFAKFCYKGIGKGIYVRPEPNLDKEVEEWKNFQETGAPKMGRPKKSSLPAKGPLITPEQANQIRALVRKSMTAPPK